MMRVLPLFFALTLLPTTSVHAESEPPDLSSLAEMSIDELADLEITSLGKKATRLSQAPASLFVITSSDIRRSGATTLPEALRLAPNLQVAQTSSTGYAISARGFNGTVANKLQVLIDGRIIYTPLFSGVLWDAQDVMLEDIERIEIISGPEDASWGANSVNGVINIITRSSKDTQGGLVSLRTSGEEHYAAFRQGIALDSDTYLRVYARGNKTDEFGTRSGIGNNDEWERGQAGFRLDRAAGSDKLQLQGNIVQSTIAEDEASQNVTGGINLLAQWQHENENGSSYRALSYLDHLDLDYGGATALEEQLSTFFIELQHNLATMGRHSLLWGVDYRYSKDRIDSAGILQIRPHNKSLDWVSIYATDRIQIADNLHLTLSGRIENNDYSGTEFMPSVRLAYNFAVDHLLWGAASRAIRTPSRIDKDFFASVTVPTNINLNGGPDFDSETAEVFQLGYRGFFASGISYNATLFRAHYDELRGIQSNITFPPLTVNLTIDNAVKGSITGLESWGAIQVTEDWRINLGGVLMDRDFETKNGFPAQSAEGNDPSWQLLLKSEYNLSANKELDIQARKVSRLNDTSSILSSAQGAPGYTAIDARFAWWIDPKLEVSLTGKNLFDSRHVEFTSANSVEIERSFMMGIRWDF